MKFDENGNPDVAPYTGAWIEIFAKRRKYYRSTVAPYTGAWIEIFGKFPKIYCW